MRLRSAVLLALPLFALGLAATSHAVPTLVEFKIKDVVGSLDNGHSGNDGDVVAPGKSAGNGKSGEKGSGKPGKPDGHGGEADLKALTLWLSTNGKDWTKVSSDLVSLSSDKITARLDNKQKDDATGMFEAFNRDVTGEPSEAYYVGVSTSSNSYSGAGAMSARLVSWKLISKHAASGSTAVPEPLLWPLLGAAALGLGYALRPRRKD